MITKVEPEVTLVQFGNGTLKTVRNILESEVEISNCKEVPLGSIPGPTLLNSQIIKLNFKSIESIDIFIRTIQDLKADMEVSLKVGDN